ALVVGTPTFGKGLVQSLWQLTPETALQPTTARWYTPSGRTIQRKSKNEAEQEAQVVAAEQGRDTTKVDSAPVFHTDRGRAVVGGGGIRPDLFVGPDTFTTAERNYMKALGDKIPVFRDVLSTYSLELKGSGRVTDPAFTVGDDMVAEVLRRLRARGTGLPDSVAAGARALALARAGYTVRLHGRRKKAVPKPLELTVGPADVAPPPAWLSQAGVVILAVRDDAIPPLADALARGGGVRPEHVVLHLSGVQGQEALGSLVPSRAALGSLHPLQTIADPERAPERLKGAWAAVEGMPRAVDAAERLARALGMRPFRLTGKTKAIYHAGAVFASNYFVVVEAVAQRLLRHAGLSEVEAW